MPPETKLSESITAACICLIVCELLTVTSYPNRRVYTTLSFPLGRAAETRISLIVMPAPVLGSILMPPVEGNVQHLAGRVKPNPVRFDVPVKFENVTSSDVIVPPLLMRSESETAYVPSTMQKGIRLTTRRRTARITFIVAPPNVVPGGQSLFVNNTTD
jgi:hypothetical protein